MRNRIRFFLIDTKRGWRIRYRRLDGRLSEKVLTISEFAIGGQSRIWSENTGLGSVALNETERDFGECQNNDDYLWIKIEAFTNMSLKTSKNTHKVSVYIKDVIGGILN